MSTFDRRHPRPAVAPSVGVGFKAEHFDPIVETRPELGFFEVHAENYMGAGGPPHRRLDAIRERYPLSLHGVGLSIGSPGPLDKVHLGRLAAVARRFEPALVSEHLAWSTHEGAFFNDLLPLPYTLETLTRVADHIDEVQTALQRRILLENPSTYVVFAESTFAETDFLREIARRTGCGLLLDVNNIFVSATNHSYDPYRYLAEFPLHAVGETHLAGYAEDADDAGLPLLIDAHNSPVRDPVWALYAEAIRRLGGAPTLIEWDNDLPAWPALLDEARRAERVMAVATAKAGKPPMPFETTIGAFAAALGEPSAAPPAMTRGRSGAPDARRFSVYRNNVAVGLIGALEARYPALRRIAGEDTFRALARAFIHAKKPRSPVMIAYGEDFPEFVAAREGAEAYLADVARLENAWVQAYHAADAAAATVGDLVALSTDLAGNADRVPSRRAHLALFDAGRLDLGLGPNGDGAAAPVQAIGEDALITRPEADVRVRILPPLGYDFALKLREGATLIEAALGLDDPDFDFGTHLVGLVESGAVASIMPGALS